MRLRCVWLLVVLAVLISGCSHESGRPPRPSESPSAGTAACAPAAHSAAPTPDRNTLARVTQALERFAARAWNPQAPPEHPSTLTGGAYVNYRSDWDGVTDPAANSNILDSGRSDAQAGKPARHDPLNDLLALRDVDAALAAGVTSTALTRLRCLLNPVTEAEFVSYGVARGWVYQQLVDLSRLDTNGPWLSEARAAASQFAHIFAQPSLLGATPGAAVVRPDEIAESAAALVDAGTRFNKPQWTSLGTDLATALITKTADPKTGLFPGKVTLRTDGSFTVAEALVKVGAQAQLLDALLQVYTAFKTPTQLAAVRIALASLLDPKIGVIDTKAGGWFYGVNSDGTAVRTAYKESRQAWMLPLLQHASTLIPAIAPLIATFKDIVANKLYQSPSQGYPYRTAADFGTYIAHSRGTQIREDWVTTEATAIAVSVLLGDLS